MNEICFLNDRILPLAEACIDPRDRGFLFGDALYEVVKVVDGVLLHLEPHLQRLRAGLQRVEIAEPEALEARCRSLLAASGLGTGHLYLQVTRGPGPRSHLPAPDLSPTLLILPVEQAFAPPAGRRMRALSLPDLRWQHRDIKTTSLMATVTGNLAARQQGLDEVIWIGPRREVREGGRTNVFVRRGQTWSTHPTDGSILEGVTRATLIGLAAQLGMAVEERAPSLAELDSWQEALLCGTLTGVQPLVEVDGERVGQGDAGEWTTRVADAFERYERQLVAAELRPG